MPVADSAALSKKPPEIARDTMYVSRRYSAEVYPIISTIGAPGMRWSAMSAGAKTSLEVGETVSLTLDLTSTATSALVTVQTVESGVRLQRHSMERRVRPFLDLRAGYLRLEDNSRPFGPGGFVGGYSFGTLGLVAGAGVERGISRTFSLTGMATYGRGFVTSTSNAAIPEGSACTSLRFALGLRYNPGRFTNPPNLRTSE